MAYLFCCYFDLVNLISAEVANLIQVRRTPDLFIPRKLHHPRKNEPHLRLKAKDLAAKRVGVRVLASLAGYANISTTQRYIDVNDDMKRQAVALI
jgi:hypothetical protein